MVGFVDQRIGIEDILRSTAEDGEVRMVIGDSRNGVGVDKETAFWGPDGFISMPSEPTEKGSAMCFYIQDGNTKRVLGIRDNRNNVKVGELKPGDRAIVSSGAARLFLKNEDDQIVMYTETEGGDSMLMRLDGSKGVALLQVGGSYIEISDDAVRIGAAGGACMVTISAAGLAVDGAHVALNTASGNLGVLSPLVPPPTQTNAVAFGPSLQDSSVPIPAGAAIGSNSWVVAP